MPSVVIEEVTPEENHAAVAQLLGELGMSLQELRQEAASRCFRSEEAALAWFVISSVVDE